MMPKYSIVTLTYGERTPQLKSAIEAVLLHGKEYDFEYIVVSNCASKSSRDLLSVYTSLPFFKWIPLETNIGTSARNLALDKANGEFIVNVDDDVIVGPKYIEVMEKYMESNVALVGPQGAMYDPNGECGFFGKQDMPVGSYVDFVTSWICMYRNGDWRYDSNLFSLRDESDLQIQMKLKGFRLRKSEHSALHNCVRDYNLGGKTFPKDNEYFVNKWNARKGEIIWESSSK